MCTLRCDDNNFPFWCLFICIISTIHFVAGRFGFGCLDDETVAAVRESLNLDVLPRHLSFLESLLVSSSSGSHEIYCLLRFTYKFFHSCYSNIGRLDCWHRRAKHRWLHSCTKTSLVRPNYNDRLPCIYAICIQPQILNVSCSMFFQASIRSKWWYFERYSEAISFAAENDWDVDELAGGGGVLPDPFAHSLVFLYGDTNRPGKNLRQYLIKIVSNKESSNCFFYLRLNSSTSFSFSSL